MRNKKTLLIMLIITLLMITGCSSISTEEQDIVTLSYKGEPGITYLSDMVIISFKEEATINDIKRVLNNISGKIVNIAPDGKKYHISMPDRTSDESKKLCEYIKSFASVDSAVVELNIQISVSGISD